MTPGSYQQLKYRLQDIFHHNKSSMFVFAERTFQVTDIRLHMGSPDQVCFLQKKFFCKTEKKDALWR